MVAVDVKHHVFFSYLITNLISRFRSCVKVEVDVLGSPSLMVFVDAKQHVSRFGLAVRR